MVGRLSPSRLVGLIQSHRRNPAPVVTPRINTSTATTANNNPNYSARFAHRLFNPIIVLENHSRLNNSARTASTPYSAGKYVCTSLFISAGTITAHIVSTLSKNLTHRNNLYKKINLPNSSSAIFTANIYSRLKSLSIHLHGNLSSTLQRFTTLKISSGWSSPFTSPSPSPPEKLPTFFALSLTLTSLIV